MHIHPIRNKSDHEKSVARITALMASDPRPGTPESDELEVLAQIIEYYEKKHFDLGQPEPEDLIAFAMEQRGLTASDMVAYLGSASRVSAILRGKRRLTLPMIAKLHSGLGLPLDVLVMGTLKKGASTSVTSRPSSIGEKRGVFQRRKRPRAQGKRLQKKLLLPKAPASATLTAAS